MKVLVFGSLNIDKVYAMPHLPQKGETLTAEQYEVHVGGKGLNQAVSFAKAGAEVYMAGKIGSDGKFLADFLRRNAVNTDCLLSSNGFTGHAVIEVDKDGQNQMILFGGANREITTDECDSLLNQFDAGDLLLTQYETSCVEYITAKAKEKGLITAFNPSPFVPALENFDLSLIDYLILNEEEGMKLSRADTPVNAAKALQKQSGGCVIMTLGKNGVYYCDKNQFLQVDAFRVNAVDTTGAGDTFTGYVLQELIHATPPLIALKTACGASAVAVTKFGAAETIPDKKEVEAFLRAQGC